MTIHIVPDLGAILGIQYTVGSLDAGLELRFQFHNLAGLLTMLAEPWQADESMR